MLLEQASPKNRTSIIEKLCTKSSKGLTYYQSQCKLPKYTNQTLLYGEKLGRYKKELKKSNVAGIFVGAAKFRNSAKFRRQPMRNLQSLRNFTGVANLRNFARVAKICNLCEFDKVCTVWCSAFAFALFYAF